MSLELVALREGAWSLDEVVDQANRLLPDVLPKDASGRAAETVNQRLLRHYTTQGLIDEPLKEGREARYLFRHLLQLLVVRRLLAEGFSASVVGRVMDGRSDSELEALLTGHLNVQLVPARGPGADRAEFLRQVRQRAGLDAGQPVTDAPHAGPSPASGWKWQSPDVQRPSAPTSTAPALGPFHESSWSRVVIGEGLELMVRDDFRLPTTRLGDAELMQLLKATLLYLEQKQRGKP